MPSNEELRYGDLERANKGLTTSLQYLNAYNQSLCRRLDTVTVERNRALMDLRHVETELASLGEQLAKAQQNALEMATTWTPDTVAKFNATDPREYVHVKDEATGPSDTLNDVLERFFVAKKNYSTTPNAANYRELQVAIDALWKDSEGTCQDVFNITVFGHD